MEEKELGMKQPGMRPLGVLGTVGLLVASAATLYVTHYVLIPTYIKSTGQPYLVGYLIGWPLTMSLFLAAALAGYVLEGNRLDLRSFTVRFRLASMTRGDWLWAIGLFAASLAMYFGLGFTSSMLASIPFMAPHPDTPPDFGPEAATVRVPGYFMGMPLAGKWWVALVFVAGWLLNTFGEELWFRGYLLPRQELSLGSWAWAGNGLMFWLNHVWQPWNLLLILPSALLGAYVAQRRRSTWVLIIMHGLMNMVLVVMVVLNVVGVAV